MLVKLSFPSKTKKTTCIAVYEFADGRTLDACVATLKATNAKRANKETTTFEVIDSHSGPIYRWDTNANKFVSERKQLERAYFTTKVQEYRAVVDKVIDDKISEFFTEWMEDYRLLHKPMGAV